MSDTQPVPKRSVNPGSESPGELRPDEAAALLRACFAQYRVKLLELVRPALEQMGDLFESNRHIPDGELESFLKKRSEWLDRFDKTLCDLFERRMDGMRRKGRRLDTDASLATLRVLTPFDQDRQAALKDATRFLDRFTRRETAALDLRVDLMSADGATHDIDNPFAVTYVLDAIGASARAVYPSPRIWRSFMERLLEDLTPDINKLYISLNRFLADRGVLPEIKAALRARSELRPDDDRELFPTFTKLLHVSSQDTPIDVVVPDLPATAGARPALVFAETARPAATGIAGAVGEMSTSTILAGLAALSSFGTQVAAGGRLAATAPAVPPDGFPSLDPLMALGTSSPLFATLAHWQQLDLPTAIARAAPQPTAGGNEGTVVPLNLIPHIRTAINSQIQNDTDRITMDVIALLFDYIFRDPSIPDELRSLFGKLQVPIVKAALLDRTFFSDRRHSARLLLDNLAEAAVGATQDDDYQTAFSALAAGIVDEISRDFDIDVGVFRAANARLAEFIDSERSRVDTATTSDVRQALADEQGEADRAIALAYLRDRLAGLEIPFEVRSFTETVWADHLVAIRRELGPDSPEWNAAVQTLDDMLWSIMIKERSSQKARLTRMIPKLIGALRRGCTAVGAAPERVKSFFEALYQLHIAAIRTPVAPEGGDGAHIDTTVEPPATPVNVHDFVSEMVVGTWLAFTKEGRPVNARLTWVSPLRTKYLFTSRARSRAFVYTPEELAYELASGLATLVVEPVALFDRAVSAALDSLAAKSAAGTGPAPASA